METQIISIGNKITDVIQKNSNKLSEIDNIDNFLDNINLYRKEINRRIDIVEKTDKLFSKLTWFDANTEFEKQIVRLLINKGKEFYELINNLYITDKQRYKEHGLFYKELERFEISKDDLNETLTEVEHIFFELREDKEFNELIASI